MKAVTGVFRSRSDAERAWGELRSSGVAEDRATLLTPDNVREGIRSVPSVAGEQPGMGKGIGAVLGAAAGFSSGPLAVAALIPGVGHVFGIGLLGGALLAAAGGSLGAVAGEKVETAMTAGLPEDELFVYEDALRKGRSLVIAMAKDDATAERFRLLLDAEGAESIDAAREQWWIGLRSAEQEHYIASGREFNADEQFYRLGFESALHARSRCKEYDQVLSEMDAKIEELQRQHPGVALAIPFIRGYERGRDYYQQLCSESKAA